MERGFDCHWALTAVIVIICGRRLMSTPDTNKRVNQAERDYIKNALEEEWKANQADSVATKVKVRLTTYFMHKDFGECALGSLAVMPLPMV